MCPLVQIQVSGGAKREPTPVLLPLDEISPATFQVGERFGEPVKKLLLFQLPVTIGANDVWKNDPLIAGRTKPLPPEVGRVDGDAENCLLDIHASAIPCRVTLAGFPQHEYVVGAG